MFTMKTVTALLFSAAAVSAAPTPTQPTGTSSTVQLTGVTHFVKAGAFGQLKFDPEITTAQIGDVVEFHFAPKNHSVAQSNFANPCQPNPQNPGAAFFAGFNFAVDAGQSKDVFQIVVEDTKPIWYYCPQTKGNHCQMGMAGVINQPDSPDFSLVKYKEAAAKTGTSVVGAQQGGKIIPNPRPLDGI